MTAPSVLVAKDSLVIRAVLVEQLRSRGYRVLEAGDGQQALAARQRERPDVVLLDVEMPQLDGHAVLAGIKADPRLADIPLRGQGGRPQPGRGRPARGRREPHTGR